MHQWGLRSLTWTYHSSQASEAWPSTPLLGPEHPVSPRPSAWACVWAFPLCLTWKIHIHQSVLGLKPCRSANEVCYQGSMLFWEEGKRQHVLIYIYIKLYLSWDLNLRTLVWLCTTALVAKSNIVDQQRIFIWSHFTDGFLLKRKKKGSLL